jgi:hypothetical protein
VVVTYFFPSFFVMDKLIVKLLSTNGAGTEIECIEPIKKKL